MYLVGRTENVSLVSEFLLVLFFFVSLCIPTVHAQTNGSLPVALTVSVSGTDGQSGQIVTYNEGSQSFSVSRQAAVSNVYGVTVERPPLVFSTATNTTPVITSGAAYVRVNNSGGPIRRGDFLVTSSQAGVAMKASPEDDNVFAVALDDSSGIGSNASVLAQVDSIQAKALLEAKRKLEEEAEENEGGLFGIGGTDPGSDDEEEKPNPIKQFFEEYIRGTVAAVVAIGALFFIMYTYRTTIINATQAVGRNPRARNAIMTVSVENIIFAIIIGLIAIFIAIAILVLPVV